jgi:hypothetical protein
MEKRQIANIGDFCLSEECEEYKRIGRGNIIKYGLPFRWARAGGKGVEKVVE